MPSPEWRETGALLEPRFLAVSLVGASPTVTKTVALAFGTGAVEVCVETRPKKTEFGPLTLTSSTEGYAERGFY